MKKNELQTKKIIARKIEKIRLKKVKNYTKRKIEMSEKNVALIIDLEIK